jgi:uncharacterized membrane protein
VTCGDGVAREASAAGALSGVGTAGGSARREYERRHDRREKNAFVDAVRPLFFTPDEYEGVLIAARVRRAG